MGCGRLERGEQNLHYIRSLVYKGRYVNNKKPPPSDNSGGFPG